MQEPLAGIDHIIYGTPDLERTISEWEVLTGVRPRVGGQHLGQGTCNALLSLGPTTYLEIMAPDPKQPEPNHPRWLGMDDLPSPRLLTWVAVAPDLESIVRRAARSRITLGKVLSGGRSNPDGTRLAWQVTDPHVSVCDGIVPFYIDWQGSPHPAASAPKGVELTTLRAEHPDADRVAGILRALELELPVSEGRAPTLIATLQTPNGQLELI
ncbi:MAG: VOC family protein [Planctomycetota bacterium]|jgi:hypothetical protein